MDTVKLEALLDEATRQLEAEEQNWLRDYYSQPTKLIRDSETMELPVHSVTFPVKTQEAIIKVLQEADVPFVNTVWRKISEQLPAVNYVFINWSSIDEWSNPQKNESNRYRINVSAEEYQRIERGDNGTGREKQSADYVVSDTRWIPPAACAAAAGTVVLIGLVLPGHPILLVPALVAGVAIGAGVYYILQTAQTSDSPSAKRESSGAANRVGSRSGIDSGDSSRAVSLAVSAARDQNMRVVSEWCRQLRETTLRECQENVK